MTTEDHDLETISLIKSLKRRQAQRPPDIDPDLWDSVEISEGPSFVTLSQSLKIGIMERAYERSLGEFPSDHKAGISALYDVAIHQLMDVLADPASKDSVKLQAAQYIIDHTVGKAKQEIEHSGSLALEIRAQAKKANEIEMASMREVGSKELLDNNSDPVNAFLTKYIPDGFVVGKKGDAHGQDSAEQELYQGTDSED